MATEMFGESQASSSATNHKIYLILSTGLPLKVKSFSEYTSLRVQGMNVNYTLLLSKIKLKSVIQWNRLSR